MYQYPFCTKPFFYFRLQADIAIRILREVSVNTVLTPSPISLSLATLLIIHEKNRKCLDVNSTGFTTTEQEHFHQPNSLSIPAANPADQAIVHFSVLPSSTFFMFSFCTDPCNRFPRDSPLIISLPSVADFPCRIVSCHEYVEEVGQDVVEGTRRHTKDNKWYVTPKYDLISLPFVVGCVFWPLVQRLAYPWSSQSFPNLRTADVSSRSTTDSHGPILWMYSGFFSCLQLTVWRHHLRWFLRYPHGLQFGRTKVSLADHITCLLRKLPQNLFSN